MPPLLSAYITKKRMEAIKDHLVGDILDLGCGYSRVPNWLEPTQRYVGVDIAPRAVEWLQKNYPNHHFYQRNFENQEIDLDIEFDTILMAAILEHLASPDLLFQQLKKCLKPNGKIVITTPTPLGGFIHTVGSKLGLFYAEAADEHEKFYGFTDIEEVTSKSGFEITKYEKFLFGGNQLILLKIINGSL